MRSPYFWPPGKGKNVDPFFPPFSKCFRITRAERSSIRTAVASFYKEAMQNLFKLLPVALALGAIISSSTRLLAQPEQPTPDELRAKISQDLPGWLKQYNVPSASVAYIANGRLAWTVVAGEQSPGVPATDKTLYNIASLTKPIVAETITGFFLPKQTSARRVHLSLLGRPRHQKQSLEQAPYPASLPLAPDRLRQLAQNDERHAYIQVPARYSEQLFGRRLFLRRSVCAVRGRSSRSIGSPRGTGARPSWHEGYLLHRPGDAV